MARSLTCDHQRAPASSARCDPPGRRWRHPHRARGHRAALVAQIQLRNNRRLQAAMRSSRLPAVKQLRDFDFTLSAVTAPRADRESARARLRRAPGERDLPRAARCRQHPPRDQPRHRGGTERGTSLSSSSPALVDLSDCHSELSDSRPALTPGQLFGESASRPGASEELFEP